MVPTIQLPRMGDYHEPGKSGWPEAGESIYVPGELEESAWRRVFRER